MLEAAAAAHDAADSDSDSGANAADDRRWLQPRAGTRRCSMLTIRSPLIALLLSAFHRQVVHGGFESVKCRLLMPLCRHARTNALRCAGIARYQAVLPTMAPSVGSEGPAAAAIAAAREPVRSVLEHVPDAERVEKKRKTGETPTPEAEGPEDSDDKKHRPDR